jgi:hypothetical protein
MHTHRYETKEYGEVIVIVNGDWSGEAIVRWNFVGEKEPMKYSEAVLPANLLLAISKVAAVDMVRDRLISVLEGI